MPDDADDEILRACPWISSEAKESILRIRKNQRELNDAKYKHFSFKLHTYDEGGNEHPLYMQDFFAKEAERKKRARIQEGRRINKDRVLPKNGKRGNKSVNKKEGVQKAREKDPDPDYRQIDFW